MDVLNRNLFLESVSSDAVGVVTVHVAESCEGKVRCFMAFSPSGDRWRASIILGDFSGNILYFNTFKSMRKFVSSYFSAVDFRLSFDID